MKKSYNIPGYHRGDMDSLTTVFDMNSALGRMTFEGFLESRYLRFWPGNQLDAEDIWRDITGEGYQSPQCSRPLCIEQLPELLARLDDVSIRNEMEMEQERVSWEIEELNYDYLERFFENKARGRKLSFPDFISFDYVQAEMWYNEKG